MGVVFNISIIFSYRFVTDDWSCLYDRRRCSSLPSISNFIHTFYMCSRNSYPYPLQLICSTWRTYLSWQINISKRICQISLVAGIERQWWQKINLQNRLKSPEENSNNDFNHNFQCVPCGSIDQFVQLNAYQLLSAAKTVLVVSCHGAPDQFIYE